MADREDELLGSQPAELSSMIEGHHATLQRVSSVGREKMRHIAKEKV